MWRFNIPILILLLASCTFQNNIQGCQNLLQTPGKCRGCSNSAYLYQGSCYQKVEGCNQYIAHQVCVTCQFSYTLNQSRCNKDFEIESTRNHKKLLPFFDSYMSIKFSSNLKLTRAEYSSISRINQYFRNYKKSIERALIVSINVLQTNQGIIAEIFYKQQFTYFQAAATINYFDQIELIYFLQLENTQKTINQLSADSQIRFKSQLSSSTLESIKLKDEKKIQMFYRSEDQLKLYKVTHSFEKNNDKNNEKNKNNLSTFQQVTQTVTMEKAKKYVGYLAPELTKVKVIQEKQSQADNVITYQFTYANRAVVKITFDKATQKYEIQQYIVAAAQNPGSPPRGSRPLPGGFFPLTNYRDVNFIAVKQFLYENYPQIKKVPITKAELQVVSGVNIKITFQDTKAKATYIAIVFKSLKGQIQIRSITKNQQSILRQKKSNSQIETLLGGYTKVQLQKDAYLTNIVDKIKETHPQMKNSMVQAAGFQVVSGLNYKVILMQSKDTYIFDIYQNLQKEIFILDAKKNGEPYLRQMNQMEIEFDWKKDEKFQKGYEKFKKEINILNFLPIESVNRMQVNNEVVYNIIYSKNEHGAFKHSKDTDQFQVLSYILQGSQLYQPPRNPKNVQKKQRTITELLQFLKTDKPQYFSNIFLKAIRKSIIYFILEVGTPEGLYEVQIEDMKKLVLKKVKLLSNHSCFEVSTQQIKNDETIKKVVKHTRKTMNIQESFELQILQIQVNSNFLTFRLLFRNFLNKKLQIYVNSNSQGIVINESEVKNEGYEKIPFKQLSDIILKANPIAKKIFQEKLVNSRMLDAKRNLTNIKLVYSSKQFTNQVILTQDLGKAALKLVQDRTLKLPQGYKSENIVKKQKAQSQEFYKALTQKINERFGKYLLKAPIILIHQQNEAEQKILKILFDSEWGIFQAIGGHSTQTNETSIDSFLLTNIQKSSFFQCNSLKEQKCQICKESEISSDGRCFQQIQGCQLQIGNVCITCAEKWIQSDKICIRECAQLF